MRVMKWLRCAEWNDPVHREVLPVEQVKDWLFGQTPPVTPCEEFSWVVLPWTCSDESLISDAAGYSGSGFDVQLRGIVFARPIGFKGVMFGKNSPRRAVYMYGDEGNCCRVFRGVRKSCRLAPAGPVRVVAGSQRSLSTNTESGVDSTFNTPPMSQTTLFSMVAVARA